MDYQNDQPRRRSLSNSPFSNSSFARDLYGESPNSLNSFKRTRKSLNSGDIRNYESQISSEIYGNWSPNAKNVSRYIPVANHHTPLSFSRSKIRKEMTQEPPLGFWRHPSLDIIFKRIRKAGVGEETIKRLIVNVLAIIIIQCIKNYINKRRFVEIYLKQYNGFRIYLKYFNIFVHIILLYNVIEAALRFVRPKDTFLDLSLTPIQRKLFGLDPHAFPPSSLNDTITPPRYVKSSPQVYFFFFKYSSLKL